MSQQLQQPIVLDTSVLLNFLRINRLNLIAWHSYNYIVTDHVASEITDHYPKQQERFAEAKANETLRQISVTNPTELAIFASLEHSGKLGAGSVPQLPMPQIKAISLRLMTVVQFVAPSKNTKA